MERMSRIIRNFIYIFLSVTALSCSRNIGYVTVTGYAQGGTYSVKFNMEGVGQSPEAIRDSIDSILRSIDSSLSGYNRKSLLSRFNSGETIMPDSLFIDIYGRAADVFAQTGGAVDVASAPLFDIWGFGFANDTLPSDEYVRQTLAASGSARLKEDMKTALSPDGSLRPEDLLKEMGALPRLNYNAIAQGYSCDVVAAYLYSLGVKDMLVDIGEIFCDGVNPSGLPWTLGIDRPVDGNNEPGADIQGIFRAPEGPHGIVTSGNYRKFYVRDGKKYAHTIDPRTGYPVEHTLLSATVVAPDATLADAYATYCMVVGLEESRRFIYSRPGLEACLIYDDNGVFRTWCSDGFVLESND
jgi:thiamine biosynthesis lipoprotein